MEIYVLQVKTGYENHFLLAAAKMPVKLSGDLSFPRRKLPIRKAGKESVQEVPFYGGYLFYQCENLSLEDRTSLKRISGFNRFLPSNDHALPLPREEKEIMFKLIYGGGLIEISQVIFNEEGKIVVKEGPLKGYEGKIIKVDRRKRRAKIKLDLYKESYLIDFGFELLNTIS